MARYSQGTSKHEVVREEYFTSASTEAAAHLRRAVYPNLLPPAADLTQHSDNSFPMNDVLTGMGYQVLPLCINGEEKDCSVMWDEQLMTRERIQEFLSITEKFFCKVGRIGPGLPGYDWQRGLSDSE